MTTAHTSGSIRVTPEGLQKVINRMAELEKDRDPYTKGWTQEDLVKKSGSSLSTVKRFLKGESISRHHVIWITGALNLEPLEVISPKEWNQDTGNLEIDWWEVCHTMLDNQQEQQRIRRKASEMGFEVNVHVPLGLVERKQQQRRDENVERGQVYQLEKEVITKTYEHNDFLQEVITQSLETQFTDIHSILSQLQPTDKTRSLVINLKSLQDETPTIAVFQEICNQIYLTAFTENPEIPEVNNAPQLKRIIPQLKKQLQTQNIALILNNCKPNQTIITFCGKLIDVLHIAFITDQPLDAPLRGFPPNQPNLLNAIQTWINEIE
jgi:K+-transporting ATPase c subunit